MQSAVCLLATLPHHQRQGIITVKTFQGLDAHAGLEHLLGQRVENAGNRLNRHLYNKPRIKKKNSADIHTPMGGFTRKPDQFRCFAGCWPEEEMEYFIIV